MDEELALNMRAAGCRAVTMGIESGDERILMLLKKGETKEQMRKAVTALKKAGLVTTLFFMLGNPTESDEDIKATYEFMRELAPFMIQVAFFTPYPGSAYYDETRPDTDFSRLSHYNDLPYNASNVSDEKLLEWQKRFYRSHYLSPRFALNYLRYRAPGMLFNPSERKLLIDATAYVLRLGKK